MVKPNHIAATLGAFLFLATTSAHPIEMSDVSAIIQDKIKRSQNAAIDLLASFGKSLSSDPERAKLENSSAGKNMFNILQTVLVNILKPQPIVDTLREEEKYGNDGEKFGRVGRKVVGGVEAVTNFLGTAVDYPFTALKSITRKASETLNNIGSKLIGL